MTKSAMTRVNAYLLGLLFCTACALPLSADFSDLPEITQYPGTITIGLVVREGSSSLRLPGHTTAWNQDGTLYITPIDSFVLLAVDTGIIWKYSDGNFGPVSSKWVFSPQASSFISVNGNPYRGEIEVLWTPDTDIEEPRLTITNTLFIEDYLRGVVAREIGFLREENFEAIKAQAIAARTYAIRNIGRWVNSHGFDLYATHKDQVYGGLDAEYELTDRAIEQTTAEVLFYEDAPIHAYYHSTCGGRTSSRLETWGPDPGWENGNPPYLVPVVDTLNDTVACSVSKYFTWKETYFEETYTAWSQPADTKVVSVLERLPEGRNHKVLILLQTKNEPDSFVSAVGDTIRRAVRRPNGGWLRSRWFRVFYHAKGMEIHGRGWGHGIGMCQMGAIGRARAGETHESILKKYFTGTEIKKINYQ